MLKIRLSMIGAKKRPIYKIVIADSRFPETEDLLKRLDCLIHFYLKKKGKNYNWGWEG